MSSEWPKLRRCEVLEDEALPAMVQTKRMPRRHFDAHSQWLFPIKPARGSQPDEPTGSRRRAFLGGDRSFRFRPVVIKYPIPCLLH